MLIANPFHSFFTCLIVILGIAHLPHSLHMPHTFHKRMELVGGVVAGEEAFSGGGSALHSFNPFNDARDAEIPSSGSLRPGSLRSETPTHDSLHSIPPSAIGENPVNGLRSGIRSSFKSLKDLRDSIWKSLSGTWSKLIQRIKHAWKSIPRLSFFKLADEKVNGLVLHLVKRYPNLETEQPAFFQNLDSQTRTYLLASHAKLQQFQKFNAQLEQNGRTISDNIRPILPHLEEGLDPLEVLAKKMALNYFKVLDMDQKTLKDNLPVEQKILTPLFGILGPDDIFSPFIKYKLKSYRMNIDVDDFLKKLVELQPNLAEIVKSHSPLNFPDLIYEQRSALLGLFASNGKSGLWEDLKGVFKLGWTIKMLDREDFANLLGMRNPKIMLEYQLQFLQPLGNLHKYEDIPESMKNTIYENFGINQGEDSLKILMQQGDIIREDLKKGFELLSEHWIAHQDLKQHLTSAQLESINQSLNKVSSVKEE